MRILVTNDDGIDSVGLHVLARAMRPHGEVIVVAPDAEYSGSGASFGALHEIRPEAHDATVEGIDRSYAVSGPPALCVMFARLGAFGPTPDLVVAGINPGANVGRSVYHSGTVGAALTARNGHIAGVAVSQEVSGWGVEGQGMEEVLANQKWETAGAVGSAVVEAVILDGLEGAPVVNVNVPNRELDELRGWRLTDLGEAPPRKMASAVLEPKPGHQGTYRVEMDWGEPARLDEHHDGGAVQAGYVAVSWLGRIGNEPPTETSVGKHIDRLLDR